MFYQNDPWDFASANLYGSILVSAATFLTYSSQSSKDFRSLALKIGMSFIKCWFSWNVDNLALFCKASVICYEDIGYYVLDPFDVETTWLQTD